MVDFITYMQPTHIDNLNHLTEQHGKNHIVQPGTDMQNSAFHQAFKAKYASKMLDNQLDFEKISTSFKTFSLNGSYSFPIQLPYNNVFYSFTKQQSAAILRNTTLSVIDILLVQSYLDILARKRLLTTTMSI